MLSLRKPSGEALRQFLAKESKRPFTYAEVGATAGAPPSGFVVDHTRIKLGEGESTFYTACTALKRWEQFQLGWVEAWPRETPIKSGEVVAVMGHAVGLWWINSCRIVYVINESGPITQFGFAYGTLPGHVECGEERFLIEWDREKQTVWYDVMAFSRPNHFSARIGYPVVRRLQRKFGRDSASSMLSAVRLATQPPLE